MGNITRLEDENKKQAAEVKYAQSDEGKQRNLREYLGLGTSGDYWLKVDRNGDNFDLYQTQEQRPVLGNWEKWWQLFTN